jgi:RNA polymerase sigma-70 factor (ECF subfamily)
VHKSDFDLSSDVDLIAAANRGDEAAFEVLYYRHRDWVVNLAYRWTGDREAALDVLQETFFVLAKKLPGFRLTSKLRTYFYPVIRTLSIAARRKAGRYDLDSSRTEAIADPSVATRTPCNQEPLEAALAVLGQEHRDVLLLRFVDDLSLAEISEVLGIPLGTVKSRLHNALDRLRHDERTKDFFEQ